jgi:hypothetical protein
MVQARRYSNSELHRIKEFTGHLFEIPSIKKEPLLIGERLIINFIEKNIQELSVIFKTPGFFPDLGPAEAVELIFDDIYDRVYASSLQPINSFLDNTDLSFFDRLSETGIVDDMHRRRKLHDFVLTLFRDREVRYRMYPVIAIFRYNAADRYMSEIFNRRGYIYKEITRFDRINTDTDTYISLIKVIILLRSVVYYRIDGVYEEAVPPGAVKIPDAAAETECVNRYTDGLIRYLTSKLPGIPAGIIRLGVKSHLPADKLDEGDSLAKLVFILCSMFQYYRDAENPYRVNEPAEKSWLGIAKHNSGYAGYDRDMIDSLYLIAEDNNW